MKKRNFWMRCLAFMLIVVMVLGEQHITTLGEGYTLVRREYPTAIGPVDIMARDAEGHHVAVEIKRRGGIDGVEQLTDRKSVV